jgi:hypothetical protein
MIDKMLDRSLPTPTIGRSDPYNSRMNTTTAKVRIKNKGSIRADYESDSDEMEDLVSPGPGQYLKPYHTSTVINQSIIHDHPQ